jgi:hypothetical protein
MAGRRLLEPTLPKKPRSRAAFTIINHAKSETHTSRKIGDPNHAEFVTISSPSSQGSEHPTHSRSVFSQSPPPSVGLLIGFCLRRSTLTGRGTPLASREAWRVASPTPRLNTKAGFINSMSYLPKYYFQDIPAAVMDDIIRGWSGCSRSHPGKRSINGSTAITRLRPFPLGTSGWRSLPQYTATKKKRAGINPALFLFARTQPDDLRGFVLPHRSPFGPARLLRCPDLAPSRSGHRPRRASACRNR